MNIHTTFPNDNTGSSFYCGYCRQWAITPHTHSTDANIYYDPTPKYYADDEVKLLLKRIVELLEKLTETK